LLDFPKTILVLMCRQGFAPVKVFQALIIFSAVCICQPLHSQTQSDIQVIAALYGTASQQQDVTAKLQLLIQDPKPAMRVGSDLFALGLPTGSTLSAIFFANGLPYRIELRDGEPLSFANAKPVQPVQPDLSPKDTLYDAADAEIKRRSAAHFKAAAATPELSKRETLLGDKVHDIIRTAGIPWNAWTYEGVYEAAKVADASALERLTQHWIRQAPLFRRAELEKQLSNAAPGADGQTYVTTLGEVGANLTGGGSFVTRKGDYYQFVSYDGFPARGKPARYVVLRIGQFTFSTPTANVEFVAQADRASAAQKYTSHAAEFLEHRRAANPGKR
jgi:hypothetical protein